MRRLAAVTAGAALVLAVVGVHPAVAAAPVGTRISLFLNPAPSLVGDEVVLVGKLERKSGTSWTGLGGRPVRLAISNTDGSERLYLDTVTTNGDGTYTRTLRAPASGAWRASFQPAFGDDHSASATQTDWFNLRYRTQITGYSVTPKVTALGSKITIKGRVSRLSVPDPTPLAGGAVQLLWSADGQTWRQHSQTTANGSGDFVFQPVVSRDGYWTTRLPAAGDHLGSSTGVTFVDGKFRTRLSLNAGPEPLTRGRTLTITGKLLQVDAAGKTKPMGGRLVRIYVKPAGSKTARLLGSVKTNAKGVYTFKYKPIKSSSYSATWVGVGNHLTSSSGWDHVSVRG